MKVINSIDTPPIECTGGVQCSCALAVAPIAASFCRALITVSATCDPSACQWRPRPLLSARPVGRVPRTGALGRADGLIEVFLPMEPSQNNFSKSTRLLYDPWRESPVFCPGIPGSCSAIQILHGHRDTSFLKPYFWDRERDGALCRTQRS